MNEKNSTYVFVETLKNDLCQERIDNVILHSVQSNILVYNVIQGYIYIKDTLFLIKQTTHLILIMVPRML